VKINEIKTENLEQNLYNKTDIEINGGPSLNWINLAPLNNKTFEKSNNPKIGYNFSLDLSYYYNNKDGNNFAIGVAAGLGFSKLATGININYFEENDFSGYDSDLDPYYLITSLKNSTESIEMNFVNLQLIPLKYRHFFPKTMNGLEAVLSLGVNISYVLSSNYILEGEVTNKGFYDQWGIILPNIPEYNYLNNQTFSNSSDLNLSKILMAATISTGIYKYLNRKTSISLIFVYNHGFTNLIKEKTSEYLIIRDNGSNENVYHSFTEIGEKANTISLSIKAGLIFKL
jgi:hypothetical protein